jgi:hypothetical protein
MIRTLAAMLGLAVVTLPAIAHHGTLSTYDRDKQWTRDAVVTKFHYANPHPQLFFDFTGDKGNVEHWAAEFLPNPAALLRAGWTRVRSQEALAPGTKIKITIAPARVAGGNVGLLIKVTTMDGMEVVSDGTSFPQTGAAAPAPP